MEQFTTTAMRTRDLYLDKKVADDALKDLLDQIEEEKTKKTQDTLKMSLGESALKRVAVVSVSKRSKSHHLEIRNAEEIQDVEQ
ncbi:hypothetical protein RHSIM_Rhsim11G0124600 [Rhododendron simsii]|uniref:Uncharacterized protein n=1 Tax=Rhododendron simsii TaxID=118357 RepID=A0A834GE71_RHOSS|nr:hypothetical protein RHSIM_Rhsim11G0124600 [Rhododendron simsii]